MHHHQYTQFDETRTRVCHKAYEDGMKTTSSSDSVLGWAIIDLSCILIFGTTYYQTMVSDHSVGTGNLLYQSGFNYLQICHITTYRQDITFHRLTLLLQSIHRNHSHIVNPMSLKTLYLA